MMTDLYITHYYVRGTDPWQNIMLLPEEEAFRKAAELASAHEGETSFYRFADFINYYPQRKATDEAVRNGFIRLGGHPVLEHPYCFTLLESDYLRKWFDEGDSLRFPLDEIPDDKISFTLGDSCAKYIKGETLEVLTKQMLCEKLHSFDDSPEKAAVSSVPSGLNQSCASI